MPKKKNASKIIVPIALALVGGGVGFFAAQLGVKAAASLPVSTAIWLVVLFVPAFFLVIAFHEGGHALAGVTMKFDFRMYVVGPFMWDKEQAGWKFKWNKNLNISGGLVICIPTGSEDLSRRFFVYAAGGPIASLFFSGISFGLFKLLLPLSSSGLIITLSYFFVMLAFLSLMIFIVTIVPMHVSGFSSDGARMLRFLRGGEVADFEMLLLKIIGSSSSGIRPKFLNQLEMDRARELAQKLDAPMGVYLHAFAHQMAFDKGEIDLAEMHLINYVDEAEQVPEGMRSAVWMDAAFFYAYAKKDLTKATAYWNRFVLSPIMPKAQVGATEAALAVLKNERPLALSKIEIAIKELPNMIDRGLAVALHEKLEILSTYAKSQ